MAASKETYIVGGIIFGVVCLSLGVSLGASYLGKSDNTALINILTMLGGWASGIGALVAAVVALRIADDQTKHEHLQDAIRCIHHTLAIINDLKGRVHSMRLMLSEGNRPLLALTRNAEAIQKRYEMLYDRFFYRHAPGHIVDAITGMSGSIFGLTIFVEGVASTSKIGPRDPLPLPQNESRQSIVDALTKLESELNDLFSEFIKVREKLIK